MFHQSKLNVIRERAIVTSITVRVFLCLALALSSSLSAQEAPDPEPRLLELELEEAGISDAAPQSRDADTAQDTATPDPFIDALNRQLDAPATVDMPDVTTESEEVPRSGFLYILRVISAFSAVIGLIVFVGYLVRKLGKRIPLLAGAELGTILGRVFLARGTALHFVRTGGRVLVLGITNNSISLLKEFDADEFDALRARPSPQESERMKADDFLAQFEESSRALRGTGQTPSSDVEDEDLSSLRGDIRRLRDFIKRDSGEPED